MSTTTDLPSVPAGYRWQITYKRAWAYLSLQRKTWYGFRTVTRQSLNPSGMTMRSALLSCADDIAYSRGWGI